MFKNYPEIREVLRSQASEFFHKYSVPRWMLFIHDTVAVFIAFLSAYLLGFNLVPAGFQMDQAIIHGLIALFVYTVFMLTFHSYAGLIRHTTLTDVSLVFVSTSASAMVLVLFSLGARYFKLSNNLVIPVSILLIHYVLITVYLFFMRISVKMLFRFANHSVKSSTNRVIIYGAGEMGFIVKRVLLSDPRGGFTVMGFIDDNKQLQGKKINGIQVYGPEIFSSGFYHQTQNPDSYSCNS